MTLNGWFQIAIYFVVLTALVLPLGRFMARVFEGERTFLSPVLQPVEIGLYRVAGVDEKREQHWITYTIAMLLFNAAGFLIVYALQRLQAVLPLNPADMSAVAPDLSFNTAVSFATNTNWQNYGGESTMSYLTQMAALTTQNFVSAATGIALLIALIRAFARTSMQTVGNFWVDLTRSTLYVLLPLAIIGALVLMWQGVPQNMGPYVEATTLEGATQTLSQGPAASQIAIKQLGTNGGGFWNANSAVPYENPTPISNFLQVLFILLIPAALTNTFGKMVKDERQGWALYAAMSIIFLAAVTVCYWAEGAGNTHFAALGLDPGNMEGKEVRFGLANSSLWAVATTAASNGSVNSMHDSFTPLGGMIPMGMIMLGEIIYGGVGSGLYGMLLMVIVAVFVAGLMVGRTPEYLGKKIEAKEVKMAMLAILILPLSMLAWPAVSVLLSFGRFEHAGCRSARVQRGAVSLRVADRQQRLGLRGLHRQYALVQHDGRPRDAGRPLLRHHSDDGGRRFAGCQEDCSGVRRYLPHPWRVVRRPAGRRHHHHRRPHILPGTRARTACRALRDAREVSVLILLGVTSMSMQAVSARKKMPVSTLLDPKIVWPAVSLVIQKARSASHDQESGHVRGGGGRCSDHDRPPARTRDRRRQPRLHLPDRLLAVGHGAVRELLRGGRRGARQGAGQLAAPDAHDHAGEAVDRHGSQALQARARHHTQGRRSGAGRGRRYDSLRWRDHRGCRFGQRGGDHRRIRTGHPRVRAATARLSPAAHRCCPTGSWCASRRRPARHSSIA